ncbi:MAG TPA: four helix bundle protein [bacterium]|nr:four helix bundle protein [bacterium]
MANFEKLDVYQLSLSFIGKIYDVTASYPKDELYGITNQIRRAAVSIATNIAEGSGRFHKKDFAQFVRIARSSVFECIALLQISLRRRYIDESVYEGLYSESTEISKKLSSLINALQK